jgi:hypothetical protein
MTAPGLLDRAEALEPPQPGPAWTDDFNNILSAFQFIHRVIWRRVLSDDVPILSQGTNHARRGPGPG